MDSEDTEITLGVGRLLGLFFLLAGICAVFFSIGYSLGRSTAREQALNDQPSQVMAASPPATTEATHADEKPSAAVSSKPDSSQPTQALAPASNPQSNLTFYKAVQQSGISAQPTSPAQPPAQAAKAQSTENVSAPANSGSTGKADETASHSAGSAPLVSHTAPVTGPGTIVVQIAAISREDDAVALAGALRKKNYNVFVVNNPATSDRFYHVQVGPFATMQEAEAMKARLIAEGYNPIVKR